MKNFKLQRILQNGLLLRTELSQSHFEILFAVCNSFFTAKFNQWLKSRPFLIGFVVSTAVYQRIAILRVLDSYLNAMQ